MASKTVIRPQVYKTLIGILAQTLIFLTLDLPQCLVVFSIVILLFSAIRSLLSELSLFEFPLLRKSKGYTLDSGLTPTRSEKKKTLKACQPP